MQFFKVNQSIYNNKICTFFNLDVSLIIMKQSYQQIYWTNQDLYANEYQKIIKKHSYDHYLVVQIDPQSTYQNWIDQSVVKFIIKSLQNPQQSFLLFLNCLSKADYNSVIGDLDGLFERDQNGFSTYPMTISHDLLKQSLKQQQFDDNRFQLPPNLKIIATYHRHAKNQLPTWAFRRWDHFEFDLLKSPIKSLNKL